MQPGMKKHMVLQNALSICYNNTKVDLVGHASEPEKFRPDVDGETTFMSVMHP